MQTLDEIDGHPSADEIANVMADKGASVSRATVFNALDDLAAAGLVMRADAGPGAVRYERSADFHHHFVCKECGVVSDVPCADSLSLCLEPGRVKGRVDHAQVVFRGVCESCLNE